MPQEALAKPTRPSTPSWLWATMPKVQALMIITIPMMIKARMPIPRLPPVPFSTASALKKIPEPMTVPTTMAMATGRVYRFSIIPFSFLISPHNWIVRLFTITASL